MKRGWCVGVVELVGVKFEFVTTEKSFRGTTTTLLVWNYDFDITHILSGMIVVF